MRKKVDTTEEFPLTVPIPKVLQGLSGTGDASEQILDRTCQARLHVGLPLGQIQ